VAGAGTVLRIVVMNFSFMIPRSCGEAAHPARASADDDDEEKSDGVLAVARRAVVVVDPYVLLTHSFFFMASKHPPSVVGVAVAEPPTNIHRNWVAIIVLMEPLNGNLDGKPGWNNVFGHDGFLAMAYFVIGGCGSGPKNNQRNIPSESGLPT
jgi:hypothetical protein